MPRESRRIPRAYARGASRARRGESIKSRVWVKWPPDAPGLPGNAAESPSQPARVNLIDGKSLGETPPAEGRFGGRITRAEEAGVSLCSGSLRSLLFRAPKLGVLGGFRGVREAIRWLE